MPDQPEPSFFQRLNWRAILLGFVVDFSGSVAFGVICGVVAGVMQAGRGGDPAEATQMLLNSPRYLTAGLIVGSLFVVVGGFVTGRIARHDRILNGLALGIVDLILGLTYLGQLPAWYHTIAMVVTIPCALLGAWLAMVNFPNHEPPPDSE
jgi:hypothetical protein